MWEWGGSLTQGDQGAQEGRETASSDSRGRQGASASGGARACWQRPDLRRGEVGPSPPGFRGARSWRHLYF